MGQGHNPAVRVAWRILLSTIPILVLVPAGAIVGGWVGDSTCGQDRDDTLACLGESLQGTMIGILAGVAIAVVAGVYIWNRTSDGSSVDGDSRSQ
jgi:hypothetical protein